ncbi:MAG: hypothetical protein KDK39_15000 [Leptospiraceae bacterium]|nr:hypothetical protein [Leptospiraceae bacterium]
MANTFSTFSIDADLYPMEEIIELLKSAGYDVVRSKRTTYYDPETDTVECVYRVKDTDVTLKDPLFHRMYKKNAILVNSPTALMKDDPVVHAHDAAVNKKVFNMLKRKFGKPKLVPQP